MRKEQLCWDCKNACANACCWMRDCTPVPGWDAKEVARHKSDQGLYLGPTYAIKSCPNFVQDEKDKTSVSSNLSKVESSMQRILRSIEKLAERREKILLKGTK